MTDLIVVTGGAGFIGSNVARKLVEQGYDVIIVDDLTDGRKFANMVDINVKDYIDKDDFLKRFNRLYKGVIHCGAISSTEDWNGKGMIKNNYEYSVELAKHCINGKIPFVYTSSASVYGANKSSIEIPENEKPLNVYGYSKLLLDNWVRNFLAVYKCMDKFHPYRKVVGLRLFNVYGPGEQFKGSQASPFYRFYNDFKNKGSIKLYCGDDGFGGDAKEHLRDFVYVDDVVDVILWSLFKAPNTILNVGTGESHTFEDAAKIILFHMAGIAPWKERSHILFDDFPGNLKGRTQSYTKANLTKLRKFGYDSKFLTLHAGFAKYLEWLENNV